MKSTNETKYSKREWVRPDFKRQSLKDALGNPGSGGDGGLTNTLS
jgi:hypothetical protein